MLRTVLLRHDLPDGGWHFDWLTERSPGGPLLSFRLSDRPDAAGYHGGPGELMPDHRREYLDYEGPVSGGRGHVRRVAAGHVTILNQSDWRIHVVVDFGAGPKQVVAERAGPVEVRSSDQRWKFRIIPGSSEA